MAMAEASGIISSWSSLFWEWCNLLSSRGTLTPSFFLLPTEEDEDGAHLHHHQLSWCLWQVVADILSWRGGGSVGCLRQRELLHSCSCLLQCIPPAQCWSWHGECWPGVCSTLMSGGEVMSERPAGPSPAFPSVSLFDTSRRPHHGTQILLSPCTCEPHSVSLCHAACMCPALAGRGARTSRYVQSCHFTWPLLHKPGFISVLVQSSKQIDHSNWTW